MLLLAFLLVPVVFAELEEKTINNYVVKIDGSKLRSVEPTRTSSRVLNLSGLGIQVLENNVFDNLSTVKNLDLGNNSLSSIPNGLFSKLENLEHLNLANNNITKFAKSFEGLDHLKTLNISNNPLTSFEGTDLFGLPKSSVIFTKGLSISTINVYVFEKEVGNAFKTDYDVEEDEKPEKNDDEEDEKPEKNEDQEDENPEKNEDEEDEKPEKNDVEEDEKPEKNDIEEDEKLEKNDVEEDVKSKKNDDEEDVKPKKNDDKEDEATIETQENSVDSANLETRRKRNVEEHNYMKICINDDVLKMVAPLKENETLPIGCKKANLNDDPRYLLLDNLGIAKFEKGWFRLDKIAQFRGINISGNEIVQVTRELLNDRPANFRVVDLSQNKIERLNRGIIKNNYIFVLMLNSNRISEIETGALARMPELNNLFLYENLLTDTKFAATLPRAIDVMLLHKNRITEITPGSFSRLNHLAYLYLNDNLIQEVKSDSLHGLFRLREIRLENNRITKIEPESFRRTCLVSLNISNNYISGFEKGVFDNSSRIEQLDISYNELTNIKENFPDGLPTCLAVLNLDFNKINKLERDTFKKVPSGYLTLRGNKISKIERGSFDLPRLRKIALDKNLLTRLDIDSFRSLKSLGTLSLADNSITGIPKGFTKNMPNLGELNLSNNPIKRLQNGALYGFQGTAFNVLHLNKVPIEVIEGGLFDNM